MAVAHDASGVSGARGGAESSTMPFGQLVTLVETRSISAEAIARDKFDALRSAYEERLAGLLGQVQQVINDMNIDEAVKVLQEDPSTAVYVKGRVQEIVDNAFRKGQEDTINTLMERLAVSTAQVQALQRHADSLTSALHAERSSASSSAQHLQATLQESSASRQREGQLFQERLESLQGALEETAQERSELSTALASARAERDAAVAARQQAHAQIQQLSEALADMQHSVREAGEAERAAAQRAVALADALEDERQRMAALSARFSQALAAAEASESALSAAKQRAAAVPSLEGQCAALQQEVAQLRGQAERASALQQRLSEAEASQTALQGKYLSLGDRVESLLKEQSEAHAAALRKLQAERDSAAASAAEAVSRQQAAEHEAHRLRSALEGSQERESAVQQRLEGLQAAQEAGVRASAQLEALQESHARLQSDLQRSKADTAAAEERLSALTSQAHDQAKELSAALREEYQGLMTGRLGQLTQAAQAAEERAEAATQQLADLRETWLPRKQHQAALAEREAALAQAAASAQAAAVREAEAATRRALSSQHDAELTRMRSSAEASEHTIASLRAKAASAEERADAASRDLAALRSRAETAEAAAEAAQSKASQLASSLAGATAQVEALQRTQGRLEQEVADAEARRAQLSKQLAEQQTDYEGRLREVGAAGGTAARMVALEQAVRAAEEEAAAATARAEAAEAQLAKAVPELRAAVQQATGRAEEAEAALARSRQLEAEAREDAHGARREAAAACAATSTAEAQCASLTTRLQEAQEGEAQAATALQEAKAALQAQEERAQRTQTASVSRQRGALRKLVQGVGQVQGACSALRGEVQGQVSGVSHDLAVALHALCSSMHTLHTKQARESTLAVQAAARGAEEAAVAKHAAQLRSVQEEASQAASEAADIAQQRLGALQQKLDASQRDLLSVREELAGAKAAASTAAAQLVAAQSDLGLAQQRKQSAESQLAELQEQVEETGSRLSTMFRRFTRVVDSACSIADLPHGAAQELLSPEPDVFARGMQALTQASDALPASQALQAQVTHLETQLAAAQAAAAAAPPPEDTTRTAVLQERLADAQRELQRTEAAADAAAAAAAAHTKEAVAAAEAAVEGKWRPRALAAEAKVKSLAGKVRALRQELLTTAQSADAALAKERARAETAVSEARSFEQSLDRHQTRLRAREARVADLKSALRATRSALHGMTSSASPGGLTAPPRYPTLNVSGGALSAEVAAASPRSEPAGRAAQRSKQRRRHSAEPAHLQASVEGNLVEAAGPAPLLDRPLGLPALEGAQAASQADATSTARQILMNTDCIGHCRLHQGLAAPARGVSGHGRSGVGQRRLGLLPPCIGYLAPVLLCFAARHTLAGCVEEAALTFRLRFTPRAMEGGSRPRPSARTEAVAGLLSGAVSRTLVAPFDVVKIRAQLSHSPSHGLAQQLRAAVQQGGLLGLWRGNLPGLLLWSTYSSVQFPIYRALQQALPEAPVGAAHSVLLSAAGAAAGLTATAVTYPLDFLRTRTVADAGASPRLLRILTSQVQQHGVAGLFHGMSPALASVLPSNAVLFACYEPVRGWLAGRQGVLPDTTQAATVGSVAGTLSGLAAKVVTYPLDTARKRLQVSSLPPAQRQHLGLQPGQGTYSGLTHCLKSTVAHEGVRGLYRGLLPALAKVAVSVGPALAVYEATRSMLLHAAGGEAE